MSGSEAGYGANSGNVVVVTVGSGFGYYADGGPGGGAYGGGGGDGWDGDCDRQVVKLLGYCIKHNLRYRD